MNYYFDGTYSKCLTSYIIYYESLGIAPRVQHRQRDRHSKAHSPIGVYLIVKVKVLEACALITSTEAMASQPILCICSLLSINLLSYSRFPVECYL